jgi:hypothetical protein
VKILRESYPDFGPTLAAEKLQQRHGITVSNGTRSLIPQHDKVIYMIKPGPENDKVAGQHVTVFDYPDGQFKIRHEGRELPYSVFDRLSQIRQADIVNNKRLAATLTMAREAQLESNERRSKSRPSRPFPSASSMQ